ncbi:MAG: DUF1549 domain-containing protein [Bryobacterales bacterium]|nr:DUF1549 domain-containing protein [Bryobacterales bacterium]MBL8240521.1 DUF1549 domain-containing protein [Bryobacterales bacterium]
MPDARLLCGSSWRSIAQTLPAPDATRHGGRWRYRDWVIHALNTDMPYDQFVQEQFVGE